jgi:FHA domain
VTTRGALLTVTKGEGRDPGRVCGLRVGECAMIVRSPEISRSTGMIAAITLASLDDEDHAAVAGHLQTRAPERDGARHVFDSFDRIEDVALADDSVSSRHAMVFCDEAGLTVLDLGSTNGTFVNGERVTSADLDVGDVLRVGETRFAVSARP